MLRNTDSKFDDIELDDIEFMHCNHHYNLI